MVERHLVTGGDITVWRLLLTLTILRKDWQELGVNFLVISITVHESGFATKHKNICNVDKGIVMNKYVDNEVWGFIS